LAFKFCYMGGNYNGLVVQANDNNTIEAKILESLKVTCLIDPNDPSCFSC
jgi:tRNA U38,U39,U40 pseudouridine synthase TruA